MTPTPRRSMSRLLAGLLLVPLACAVMPTPAFALRAAGLEENSARDEFLQSLKTSQPAHSATPVAGAIPLVGTPVTPESQPVAVAINDLIKDLVVTSVGPYEERDTSWVVSVMARSTNPGFAMPDITFSVTPLTPPARPAAGLTVMLLDAQTGQALQAESLDETGTAHFQYVRPGPSATRQSPFGTYRFEILTTGLEEGGRGAMAVRSDQAVGAAQVQFYQAFTQATGLDAAPVAMIQGWIGPIRRIARSSADDPITPGVAGVL